MSAPAGRLRAQIRIDLGDYPVDAAWSADGRTLIVAGGEGALLRVTDFAAGKSEEIGRHEGGVLAVAWQKAGRLFASSGQDGAVFLWDARSMQSQRIHVGNEWSERLAFSDAGRYLAVATGRTLNVFDEAGEARHCIPGHAGAIAALAWRPKLNEIAVTGNNGARLHRLEPTLQSREFAVKGACLSANWSPDGRVLAAGMQDGTILLWNALTGTQSDITGLGGRVFATEWSANGNYLAAAGGTALVVWETKNKSAQGADPQELSAHSERLTALRFRPSGTYLVSAARDRRLLLWRVGQSDQPLDAHLLPDECTLLRFSRDGLLLAVGDARGGLSIFECS